MTTKLCGALGCRDTAAYKLKTDDHGIRVVCEEHAIAGHILERYGGDDE